MEKEAEKTAAAHQKEVVAKIPKAKEKGKTPQRASHQNEANRPLEENHLVDEKIANLVMISSRVSAKREHVYLLVGTRMQSV